MSIKIAQSNKDVQKFIGHTRLTAHAKDQREKELIFNGSNSFFFWGGGVKESYMTLSVLMLKHFILLWLNENLFTTHKEHSYI